jgi:hypothetical protein
MVGFRGHVINRLAVDWHTECEKMDVRTWAEDRYCSGEAAVQVRLAHVTKKPQRE